MSEETCATCRWSTNWLGQEYDPAIDDDDGEPAKLTCNFPTNQLPLCMQGVAQRERQSVRADATGCPVWEANQPVE